MQAFFNSPKPYSHQSLLHRYKRFFEAGEMPFQFHSSLFNYQNTQLQSLPSIAKELGLESVYCKNESSRMGLKTFKGLGASYAFFKLIQANKKLKGVVTATDGNHGKCVAWSAHLFNKPAVVFVPEHTVDERIDAIKEWNAEVIVVKGNYDKATKMAKDYAAEHNFELLQDSSWEGYTDIPLDIMSGYTTHCVEADAMLTSKGDPGVDVVFLQCGNGTWAAAVMLYYFSKYQQLAPRFVCVEPTGAACMLHSMENGEVTTIKTKNTIMAGLNCGTPSLLAFDIMHDYSSLFISIEDEWTKQAMRKLAFLDLPEYPIVAGESGAAGLAGLMAFMKADEFADARETFGLNENSRVLIFNTEGNTDTKNYKSIITAK